MLCNKCGADNPDDAQQCASCGEPLQPMQPAEPTEPTQAEQPARPSEPTQPVPPAQPVWGTPPTAQPVEQQPYQAQTQKPQNYLVWAIIGTVVSAISLYCCIGIVPGIIAIVFAAQVDSKWSSGDVQGAYQSANTAKILTIVTCVLAAIGIVVLLINLAMVFIVGASGGYNQPRPFTFPR
jgi:hypothetical protein